MARQGRIYLICRIGARGTLMRVDGALNHVVWTWLLRQVHMVGTCNVVSVCIYHIFAVELAEMSVARTPMMPVAGGLGEE